MAELSEKRARALWFDRLEDILRGAHGRYDWSMGGPRDVDEWCGVTSEGAETFGNFVGAVRRLLPEDCWLHNDIAAFDDLPVLAAKLVGLGLDPRTTGRVGGGDE